MCHMTKQDNAFIYFEMSTTTLPNGEQLKKLIKIFLLANC